MKSSFKKVLCAGLIIFLLLQLYQPARNLHYEQDITLNFKEIYNVPRNVEILLRTSCYDCHSNNTNYPWYSNIQPARFFIDRHIVAGKENLNFNEWGNYNSRKQYNKLDRIAKQIKSNEMPLSSYTLIHKNATLTANQKKEVLDWINKTKDSISLQN